MKKSKKYLVLAIISFLIISILGTLLHFTYETSNENVIVGIFSAVNESVWEHLKLIVIPMLIVSIYEYKFLKDNNNFFFSMLIRILVGMGSIVLIYNLGNLVFDRNIDIINISSYYISIFIAQIIWYILMLKISIAQIINNISLVIMWVIIVLFVVFTFIPPRIELFKDKPFEYIKVSSPLTEDKSIMRYSLIPSLLKVADYNISRNIKDVNIFETSKIYYVEDGYKEVNKLSIW